MGLLYAQGVAHAHTASKASPSISHQCGVLCSVLVLKSCEGYIPNTYHMWCCTQRQCNILYTQQAIEDLGYDTIDDLEYIRCYDKGTGLEAAIVGRPLAVAAGPPSGAGASPPAPDLEPAAVSPDLELATALNAETVQGGAHGRSGCGVLVATVLAVAFAVNLLQ